MKTVKDKIKASYREKGSKFTGYLFSASSTKQFDEILQTIKSDFPDATHHCYAWRMNPNSIEEFAQDDGEPSGTAGPPILNQLKSYGIINSGCVVVRYYGGTNLGKSGLIRAYGHTAELCLQQATLQALIPTQHFKITYPYSKQSHIDQLKNQFDLKEINSQYLEKITLEIACRSEQADEFFRSLENLRHRGITSEKKGEGFVTI